MADFERIILSIMTSHKGTILNKEPNFVRKFEFFQTTHRIFYTGP